MVMSMRATTFRESALAMAYSSMPMATSTPDSFVTATSRDRALSLGRTVTYILANGKKTARTDRANW